MKYAWNVNIKDLNNNTVCILHVQNTKHDVLKHKTLCIQHVQNTKHEVLNRK